MCVLISSIRSVAIKRLEQKLITCRIATTRWNIQQMQFAAAPIAFIERPHRMLFICLCSMFFSFLFRLFFALPFFFSDILLLFLTLYLFDNAIEYDFTTEEEEEQGAEEQQQEST